MIKPIMKDILFLGQKSEPATVADKQVAIDLLDTLAAHKDGCIGLAAMILGKGAYGIHQSGKWYTNENIDQMLMERHMAKKTRRVSSKNHLKGPKKRTEEDDLHFAESFEKLLRRCEDL